jgi:hypothetical protein
MNSGLRILRMPSLYKQVLSGNSEKSGFKSS